ncbi:MAG: nucleoside triphosphate pyrophosphohydrolase [Anaerotruncus sp.]|jgi:tetrapyrrole methylase family protein/MazG family protein|nr:nucleoside triphosphate pyrophosphohydrolase [Anaerotruncus sp.]
MLDGFTQKKQYGISDLLEIVELLRGENGCPWDREQDHHTIRKNFLEETYEVVEAIDKEDPVLLQEELGDVLLQVVFHARMEEEAGRFGFSDVCDGICKKLVERHPHVFGEVAVSGTGEVLSNWDRIKQESKGQKTAAETLRSVPAVLPALMRSEKVQHRAAKAGFDYTDCDWAMRDLESELSELKEAVGEGDQAHIEEELGDLLFSAVNVARFVKADPEHALTNSCEKFIRRFEQVETLAQKRGIDMKTTPIEELDRLWKEIKQK